MTLSNSNDQLPPSLCIGSPSRIERPSCPVYPKTSQHMQSWNVRFLVGSYSVAAVFQLRDFLRVANIARELKLTYASWHVPCLRAIAPFNRFNSYILTSQLITFLMKYHFKSQPSMDSIPYHFLGVNLSQTYYIAYIIYCLQFSIFQEVELAYHHL